MRTISERHAPDVRRAQPLVSNPAVRPGQATRSRIVADPAAALSELSSHGPDDPIGFEQTLADLIRAARDDRAALRAALAPVADESRIPQPRHDFPHATPLRQLHALVVNVVWLPARPRLRPRTRQPELLGLLQRLALPLDRPPGMDRYALRTPADILTLRLAELAARIGDPGPGDLVSTPTDPRGWIDPGVLCARIAEAEEAGWQPWPLDFDQALLRLPESAEPVTVRAAQRLVSPVGRRLAGWLRGGRPALPNADRLLADPTHTPRALPLLPLAALPAPVAAPLVPTTLIHLLRRGWYPPQPLADGSCWPVCWPTLLPGQPDLIAVAAAWHAHHPDARGGSCQPTILTHLTDTPAAPTPALLAALARAITSRSPAKRADAADALAVLAASGRLDGRDLALALTRFATRPDRQFLRSAVPALQRTLSHEATANHAISTAILGWLPAILPPTVSQPLPYTSHLLNLAADALKTTPTSTPTPVINALSTLATRPSPSPVSDASQRLLAALGH